MLINLKKMLVTDSLNYQIQILMINKQEQFLMTFKKTIDNDYSNTFNKLKSKISTESNKKVLIQIINAIENEISTKKSKSDNDNNDKGDKIEINRERLQTQINKILEDNSEEIVINKEKLKEIPNSKTDIKEILTSLKSTFDIFNREKEYEHKYNDPYVSTLISSNEKSSYYSKSLSNILNGNCFFITLYGNPSCTRNILSFISEKELDKHNVNDAITIYGPVNLLSFSKTVRNSFDKLKHFSGDTTNLYFFEVSNDVQENLIANWCEFLSFISHITILCSEIEPSKKQINDFQKLFVTDNSSASIINCSPLTSTQINIGKKQCFNIDINTLNDGLLHNCIFNLIYKNKLQLIPSQSASSLSYDIINKKLKMTLNEKQTVFAKKIMNDYSYSNHNETRDYYHKQENKKIQKIIEIMHSTKFSDDFHLNEIENCLIQKTLEFFYSNIYTEFWKDDEIKNVSKVIINEVKDSFQSRTIEIKGIEQIGKLISILKSDELKANFKQAQSILEFVKKKCYLLRNCSLPEDLNKEKIIRLTQELENAYEKQMQYSFFESNFEEKMNSITNELKLFLKNNPIASDSEYGDFFSKLLAKQNSEKNPYLGKLFYFASEIRPISKEYMPNNFYIGIDKKSFKNMGIEIERNGMDIMITNLTTCKELYDVVQKSFNLTNDSFYLTRMASNQQNQPVQIEVLNDDISIAKLNSYEFIIHCGLVVHSTQSMIESLIVEKTIQIAEDFIIKTNSKNANYHVTFPTDHHGWFNVPFEITNDSPTSETDECLIFLKMIADDITYLQEGNSIKHQYLQENEWITLPDPVFLSYPDCNTAIIYLSHCSIHRISQLDTEFNRFISADKRNDRYSRTWQGMNPDRPYNRAGKPYFVPVGFKSIGINITNFDENTCVAFHGTTADALEPILNTGFKLPSQLGHVRKGHYKLGKTYFDIPNFADAVFVSPSIKYSSLYGHSSIIAQREDMTCVRAGHVEHNLIRIIVLQMRVKPHKFTENRNTTKCIVNDQHFTDDQMEWRVPNPSDLFPYRILYMHCTLAEFRSLNVLGERE